MKLASVGNIDLMLAPDGKLLFKQGEYGVAIHPRQLPELINRLHGIVLLSEEFPKRYTATSAESAETGEKESAA